MNRRVQRRRLPWISGRRAGGPDQPASTTRRIVSRTRSSSSRISLVSSAPWPRRIRSVNKRQQPPQKRAPGTNPAVSPAMMMIVCSFPAQMSVGICRGLVAIVPLRVKAETQLSRGGARMCSPDQGHTCVRTDARRCRATKLTRRSPYLS
jgi:hypothetical protein